jgi:hypothetical protein
VVDMNRRDLKNFRDINELWDEEMEEELGFIYSDDAIEDFKNK